MKQKLGRALALTTAFLMVFTSAMLFNTMQVQASGLVIITMDMPDLDVSFTNGSHEHGDQRVTRVSDDEISWRVFFPFDASSGVGLSGGRIPQAYIPGLGYRNPTSIGMYVSTEGVSLGHVVRMWIGVNVYEDGDPDGFRGFTTTAGSAGGFDEFIGDPGPITPEDGPVFVEWPLYREFWIGPAQTRQPGTAFTDTQPLFFPYAEDILWTAAASFFGFRHTMGQATGSGTINLSGLTFFYNYTAAGEPIFTPAYGLPVGGAPAPDAGAPAAPAAPGVVNPQTGDTTTHTWLVVSGVGLVASLGALILVLKKRK